MFSSLTLLSSHLCTEHVLTEKIGANTQQFVIGKVVLFLESSISFFQYNADFTILLINISPYLVFTKQQLKELMGTYIKLQNYLE